MTTTWTFILTIFLCAAVTWIPRVLPFILVKKIELPAAFVHWLSFIPLCILSALVIDSLLIKKQSYVFVDLEPLLALIPTLLVAIKTKSLSLTVFAGIVSMAIIRFFFF